MSKKELLEKAIKENNILSHEFAREFWEDGEEPSENGICKHCGGDIEIRNPAGKCDHLFYPEACKICNNKSKDWQFHLQEIVILSDDKKIKYLKQFL